MQTHGSIRHVLTFLLLLSITTAQLRQRFEQMSREQLISNTLKRVSNEMKQNLSLSKKKANADVHVPEARKIDSRTRRVRREPRAYVTTWKLVKPSTSMSYASQHACIQQAYRLFSSVAQLEFREMKHSPARTNIYFERNNGIPTKDLAYSNWGDDIHIDDQVQWRCPSVDGSNGWDGVNLLRVLLHHIGHTLRLPLSNRFTSIMNRNVSRPGEVRVDFDQQDINTIHQYYKPCNLIFDMAMDFAREQHDHPEPNFETYFFRDQYVWKYDYKRNRAAFDMPLLIKDEFAGVPSGAQAYAYVRPLDHHLFFKDNVVYNYNKSNAHVDPSYPRRIADVFPPKKGSKIRVPDNIYAAFFNERDRLLYLFKGTRVYVYDYLKIGPTRGCCERINSFEKEFPTPYGPKLVGNIHTVFLSHYDNFLYFINKDGIWMDEGYSKPRETWDPWLPRGGKELHYIGETTRFFPNICPRRNM